MNDPAVVSRRTALRLAGLAGAALAGAPACRARDELPSPDRASRPSPVTGRSVWVDPAAGRGGDGTAARPWRRLQDGLSGVRPGQTLMVAAGTYEEDVDVRCARGTSSRPVLVRPHGGLVLLHGLLRLRDPDFWDVRGLDVRWRRGAPRDQHMVKLDGGTGWTFADAELGGARSYAALAVTGRPRDFLLSGLYVHDTHPSNDTNQDHLVYLNCGTGGGVLERSVLAHSPNGRAVKIGAADRGGDRVGRLLIRRCTMVDNRGPSNVQLAYRVSDVVVEENIMVGAAPGRASVTAFEVEGRGNVVRRNVYWDATRAVEGDNVEDGGGNVEVDPRLGPGSAGQPYVPGARRARRVGRWS